MTKVIVPPIFPSPIDEDRFAQNGDLPNGGSLRRVGMAYNSIATRQRKMIYLASPDVSVLLAPGGGDEAANRFVFRTGENVAAIRVVAGVAPSTLDHGAGNHGAIGLSINNSGVGQLDAPLMSNSIIDTAAPTPDQIVWLVSEITTADGLTSNSEWEGWLNHWFRGRLIGACVYEIADNVGITTNTGVTDPLQWEANKPIYDSNVQDLAETGTKLWQHNASHLISWAQKSEAAGDRVRVTGTTPVNVLDTSVTAWATTSPGFVLNTQFHDSQKSDVKLTLGVVATQVSGTGNLEVRVVRNGSTVITETNAAATPFGATTHTITARSNDKVDIHISADTAGEVWEVKAIGLWEYES